MVAAPQGGNVLGKMNRELRALSVVFGGLLGASAWTAGDQATLDLSEALKLARDRNGTIKSAEYAVRSAEERLRQANTAFLPALTGSYTYNSQQQQFSTGSNTAGFLQSEGGITQINLTQRLLDLGERKFSVESSSRSLDAQRYSSLQTLRTTLFSVIQQYFETLRAIELQRVADESVANTLTVRESTIARIAAKDEAEKARLQAEADYLNAKVAALSARNTTTNNGATLKAILGVDANQPTPTLTKPPMDVDPNLSLTLAESMADGIKNRPDLVAQRRSIESQEFQKKLLQRQSGISAALDLQYGDQLTPQNLQNRNITLSLSYPLFDGGRRKSQVRDQQFQILAAQQSLVQLERSARAEIESAYKQTEQNAERVVAANAALAAAQKNFEAAQAAYKAGAGTVLDVSTARVSLATARSESIQASYDLAISKTRLLLVTGRPLPGQ